MERVRGDNPTKPHLTKLDHAVSSFINLAFSKLAMYDCACPQISSFSDFAREKLGRTQENTTLYQQAPNANYARFSLPSMVDILCGNWTQNNFPVRCFGGKSRGLLSSVSLHATLCRMCFFKRSAKRIPHLYGTLEGSEADIASPT
jgi:hypothetical protein